MAYVAVLSASGKSLMPTTAYKARKLLKSGRAKIYSYRPLFTIQMQDREEGTTQPIEMKVDTGAQYIGVSVCSEKHEYWNRRYDMLPNEKEMHDEARKNRRNRRQKLRYRAPRFDNCTHGHNRKEDKWFAPSLKHRENIHIQLAAKICAVVPVTDAYFEMGQFDIQVLKAYEAGKPIPVGDDYQKGERYGYATLREAIFARDNYTCQVCGAKLDDKHHPILRMHHIGYWKHDHSNRMGNLMTVCIKCHTAANHKPGGKLYGLEPELPTFKGAAFMNTVRWDMFTQLKKTLPNVKCHITYGAMTKLKRSELNTRKTHSNDAYCMGTLHPKWRTDFQHYQKVRRNNRVLSKFYDAQYIDTRDGEKMSGSQLSCGRTKRSESRNSIKNLRGYRGRRATSKGKKPKISKGHISIRRHKYAFNTGDIVIVQGKKLTVSGTQHYGEYVVFRDKTHAAAKAKEVTMYRHGDGWVRVV